MGRTTGPRDGVSLLGMSTRVLLPALLGLALLAVVAVTTLVHLLARPAAQPLTVQVQRLPMDGSCYVVAATGRDLGSPPPPPPAVGSPAGTVDAWLAAARATPVGTSRTTLTVRADTRPLTLTGVEVSGTASPPLLQRDWSLDAGCRPGTVPPPVRSGTPTVLLRGDLDAVADGRPVSLSATGSAFPVRILEGASAGLVLDLSAHRAGVRWTATLTWSAGGRRGVTVVDPGPDGFTLLGDARVTEHYAWDRARGRWVALTPATAGTP